MTSRILENKSLFMHGGRGWYIEREGLRLKETKRRKVVTKNEGKNSGAA